LAFSLSPRGALCDQLDLGIVNEKVCQHVAHCELHSSHGRGAAHGAGRFMQAMAYDRLGDFCLTQHRQRVPIEFLSGVCHPKPS